MDKLELIIGNKAYSSWSLRPWLALKHTGVDFTETRIALYRACFKKEVLHYNPAGKVPALKHGTVTVWESLAICEYLGDLFPAAKLWPEALAERARARSISTEMHAGFGTLRSMMPMNCRATGRRVTHTAELDADIKRVESIWSSCRASQPHGPWLFGAFTIADAMFAPVALRFVTYGVTLGGDAGAYVQTVRNHGPTKEWIAAAEQEPEFIESSEVGK